MIQIIEDGSLERLILVVIVYGPLAYLWVSQHQVDDRLIDIALVILGFYFGQIMKTATGK